MAGKFRASGLAVTGSATISEKVGINAPANNAMLVVEAGATSGVPAAIIAANDLDKNGLQLSSDGAFTANLLDMQPENMETGKGINIVLESVTTGQAIFVDDNSGNTNARNVVEIVQDAHGATSATALKLQSDSNGAVAALSIDRNASGTVAVDAIKGIDIDIDQTGDITSATGVVVGVDLNIETNSAADGTINAFGHRITMTGDTDGTHSHTGLSINLGQADNNTHIEMLSSADTGDKCTISVAANGATTIATIDDDGNDDADLILDADGKIIIEPKAGDEVVVNESSANVDFRVETNATATAFVVDGGSDFVKIDAAQALHLKDLGGVVNNPASGYGAIYVNADIPYFKSDGGTVTSLLSGGGTLDEAYDQGGSGAGAIITVDGQPVQIRASGAGVVTSLAVTGSAIIGNTSAEFSNELPPLPGADTNFFVSGSIDSEGTTTRGTTVFGGDLVVSGALFASRGFKTTTTYHYALAGATVSNGTSQYISFKNTGQSTNGFVAGHYFHAPASGSLERIAFAEVQDTSGGAAGKIAFCMFVNNMSNTPAGQPPHGHVTASIDTAYSLQDDGATETAYRKMVDFSGAQLTRTGSNTFNPGDIIKIACEGDGRSYTNATFTLVFKLNEIDPIF